MRLVVVIAGLILFVLHQDFWNWNESRLVLGYMPIGLAYHALYSIAASLFWAFAIRFAWPKDLEEWAEQADGTGAE
ncbi:MAG: DUF3311 domain-containing protein [Verrucomicrobia bacterium]|nr:DUF3311 domain-containing protein [Verrucomicrobiota bacterium]MDA1086319.1 DUF3311 domain-containing protein [Verrucomicrobiota bacterium]